MKKKKNDICVYNKLYKVFFVTGYQLKTKRDIKYHISTNYLIFILLNIRIILIFITIIFEINIILKVYRKKEKNNSVKLINS